MNEQIDKKIISSGKRVNDQFINQNRSLELSELHVIAATAAPGPPKEERTENKGKGEKNERRRWTGIAAGCCCLAVLGGNAGWSFYKWSLVVVPRSR
uniref:Uncharacterized protein n=1 Tax=Solanum lycopersicum TaxID=4081 RepID=A0A3Q7I3Z8_SOLLC